VDGRPQRRPRSRLAAAVAGKPFCPRRLDRQRAAPRFSHFPRPACAELDADKLARPRRDALCIALAGPTVNLLLAVVGIGVFRGLDAAGLLTSPFLMQILPFFCLANACLAVFNLLPIPPLAASGAAEQFLGGDALSSFEDIKPFGFLLLLAGVYFNFFDFLTIPLGRLVNALLGF
jgi:Zn-dependent protease